MLYKTLQRQKFLQETQTLTNTKTIITTTMSMPVNAKRIIINKQQPKKQPKKQPNKQEQQIKDDYEKPRAGIQKQIHDLFMNIDDYLPNQLIQYNQQVELLLIDADPNLSKHINLYQIDYLAHFYARYGKDELQEQMKYASLFIKIRDEYELFVTDQKIAKEVNIESLNHFMNIFYRYSKEDTQDNRIKYHFKKIGFTLII